MLVYALGEVLARKKDTSEWLRVRTGVLLHDGDGLRTMEDSRARVRFAGRSMLELEPDSLAILKRPRNTAYDLSVEQGRFLVSEVSVFAKDVGFFPKRKDTAYTLTRVADRETEVRVHQGELAIRDARDRELAVVGPDRKLRPPELGLPPGEYWMRAASVDLLGEENPFSPPKLQRITSGP